MFQASSTAETWATIIIFIIAAGAFCIGLEHGVMWLIHHISISWNG